MTQARQACTTCGSPGECAHKRRQAARRRRASAPRPYRGTKRYDEVRELVLERDEYECHLCGEEADTIDHTPVPYSALPTDPETGHPTLDVALNPDNLRAACGDCNRWQGNRHAEEAA